MNPLFYPSRAPSRDLKSGLEKNRKIAKYSDSPKKDETAEKNLPDSWFYNDNTVTKLWEGLEVDPVVAVQPREEEKKNPFAKIEESSHKMKQLIDSYELNDQELLIRLMDLFEEENGMTESDQSNVLIEAKFKLGALISDHSGNTNAQEKMLDSLQNWFDELRKNSQTENSTDIQNLKDEYTLDVTEVASMINNSLEMRDFTSDQIQVLHREVVDKLTHQIRDLRRRCDEQEEIIRELRTAMEQQQRNLKRRPQKILAKKEALQVIEGCQRTIFEKDNKINRLKGAIQELTNEAGGGKQETASERQTSLIEQEIHNEERLASISREIELDSKIKALTDNITQLKIDLTDTNQQVWKEKQNCIQLETKVQALERQKKNTDAQLITANEKYKLLEQKYQEKVEEYSKKKDDADIAAIINGTKLEYQNKIQQLNEAHRKAVLSSNEAIEKRYKKQIADLMQVLEKGTANQVINELNTQHIREITLIKTEAQNEIETLKINQGKRMSTLIKHYESKIEQLLETQQSMKNSLDKDLNNSIESHRLEMEEDFSKRMVEFQDKAAIELAELRTNLGDQIQKLTEKVQSLEIERDCYLNIIEENDLTDEIPENLNTVNSEEDENDDDTLANSMLQLKEREIEKKVTEKFNTLLQAQRTVLEDHSKWEISKLNEELEYEMNCAIVNMRKGVMENLAKIRDMTVSADGKINTEEFDELLVESLKIVEAQDSHARKSRLDPSIPVYEVESRLSEVKSKILDLTGENEFLRLTLAQLNQGNPLTDEKGQDIVRAMRSSLSEQAAKMTSIMQEYDDMKARIAYFEEKEKKVVHNDKNHQTDKYIPIYQKFTFLIFDRDEDRDTSSDIEDGDIILRDHYYRERNTPSDKSQREKIIGIDLFDAETQTESTNKKRVKKPKTETQPILPEQSTGNTQTIPKSNSNLDKDQNELENNKLNPNELSENNNLNKDQLAENDNLDQNENNELNQNEFDVNNNLDKDQLDESNKLNQNVLSENNKLNKDKLAVKENLDQNSSYEYEYENEFSIEHQNTLFEIDPSVKPICRNKVNCPTCHKDVMFDPTISEISLTTDAVIECPHCHSEIDINKDSLAKFNKQDVSFTSNEIEQISKMERSIQNQIQDLISMKKQIREGKPIQINSMPIDLQPSLPTLIISLPTPARTPERSSRDEQERSQRPTTAKETDFQISVDSLSIEIPAIPIHSNSGSQSRNSSVRKIPSGNINTTNSRPASSLSARSFIQTVDDDESISNDLKSPISEAETKINEEIQLLLALKNNIKNKKASSNPNSKVNSDDEVIKLNIEDMPIPHPKVKSIDPNIKMTDVQIEKVDKKSINIQIDNLQSFEFNYGSPLTMSKSADFFLPTKQLNLAISQNTISLEKQKLAVSLAIETLDEIDISIEKEGENKLARLNAIENNVQTLSELKMFDNNEDEKQLADEIISTARSLKEMKPDEIPETALKKVAESTKKLLINFCQQNQLDDVDIPPLTIEENDNNLMQQIQKLQLDNQKYKNELNYFSQTQTKLKEEMEDINESTKELKMMHEEIVSSLQQTLDKVLNSNGSIDADDVKALQGQSAYFKQISKEKEQLQNENNEQNQLLKEKDMQIVSLNHDIQEKNEQIDSLTSKLSELSKHMQKLKIQFNKDQGSFDEFMKTNTQQAQVIETLTRDMMVGKDNEIKLQNRIEQLELTNQQLMNKITMKESENPISYSLISPFVLFDTLLEDVMPQQGFTLLPGNQKNDEKKIKPTSTNSNMNQSEKVRLKYNQNQQLAQNNTPKVIVPRTLSRSRYGSRNSQSNISKASMVISNNSGYTELVPVHDESQNRFLYVRKIRTDDANNSSNDPNNYFERQPVQGSVVLQKTIRSLNHRIKILENLLDMKQRELIKLRDQKVEWRQNYLSMSIQYQNARKEAARSQLMYGQTEAKLGHALQIIDEREIEIRELRDLIKQLRVSATDPIIMHQVMSNVAEDQSNAAAMHAYRKQTYISEMKSAYSTSPSLKQYAQRQAQSIQRWERRRQELIRQQQNHLMSVLEGMRLIHPLSVPKTSPRTDNSLKRSRHPTKVTKMQKGNLTITTMVPSKKDVAGPTYKLAQAVELQHPHLDFDKSWKNVNSPNPKIPKGLEKGVVAKPLD